MTRPLALFFGTRPQVIKASVLRRALSSVGPVVAVDTGQHYDYSLHQVHYDQLEVSPPDVFLGVGSGSHAQQTASMLTACEAWIAEHQPRLAVVIGDTNSTLACALAAAKKRIPVAHVEAGLHAQDRLMAEEINRRAVDAIAQVLLAPCQRVASVLSKQYPDARVENVGDVAHDVLRLALNRLPPLEGIRGYDPAWGTRFALVTLHRAELVDDAKKLEAVVEALSRSPVPCLFPAHPRTAAVLEPLRGALGGQVCLTPPVGYLESIALLRQAAFVITDSGGIQREAYWLGVPCITVRAETEWVETVSLGANHLVPATQSKELSQAIQRALASRDSNADWDRTAYGTGHAGEAIAHVLRDWLSAA